MRWAQQGKGGVGGSSHYSFLTNRQVRVLAGSPGSRECHLLTASLKEQLSHSGQKGKEPRSRILALDPLTLAL